MPRPIPVPQQSSGTLSADADVSRNFLIGSLGGKRHSHCPRSCSTSMLCVHAGADVALLLRGSGWYQIIWKGLIQCCKYLSTPIPAYTYVARSAVGRKRPATTYRLRFFCKNHIPLICPPSTLASLATIKRAETKSICPVC